jgi:hypothetical protein
METGDATREKVTIDSADAIKKTWRRREMRRASKNSACMICTCLQWHDPKHSWRHNIPNADHLQNVP